MKIMEFKNRGALNYVKNKHWFYYPRNKWVLCILPLTSVKAGTLFKDCSDIILLTLRAHYIFLNAALGEVSHLDSSLINLQPVQIKAPHLQPRILLGRTNLMHLHWPFWEFSLI